MALAHLRILSTNRLKVLRTTASAVYPHMAAPH
jgi:hypothetical protein